LMVTLLSCSLLTELLPVLGKTLPVTLMLAKRTSDARTPTGSIQVYPHWLPILKQDVLRLGVTMPELCLRQPVQLLFNNRAQLIRTVALMLEQFAVPRLAAEWHGNDCRAIGMQQQRKWPRCRQTEQRPGPAITPAALCRVKPERLLETRL